MIEKEHRSYYIDEPMLDHQRKMALLILSDGGGVVHVILGRSGSPDKATIAISNLIGARLNDPNMISSYTIDVGVMGVVLEEPSL